LEIVDGLLEFEWDPAKDASNLVKHGITFADAARVFDDPHHLIGDSTKPEYGEIRRLAVGRVDNRFITVIFTEREEKLRIISARRTRQDERRQYDQGTQTG
jgi:uncharacterized DUF497 family protein